MAFLGALVFGFPSRKIKVIGITGTNGKTTTANLSAAILEEAGYKVAVASSIKFKIGKEERENKLKMTMPGRAVLQKFLRDAVEAGCQYAIIECTSEGVLQYRHKFIRFEIMVFTNLSPEHIEHHGGFKNYRAAKGKYFRVCKGVHIINADDENAGYFLQFSAQQKVFFSLNPNILFTPLLCSNGVKTPRVVLGQEVEESQQGLSFKVQGLLFNVLLLGRFNVYNSLAAICVGLSRGVALDVCQKALGKAGGIPGRMEEVISAPLRVIVDYAFTPNALEQVYTTLISNLKSQISNLNIKSQNIQKNSEPRLICVLGACGGGRDKWKRPVLGRIAAQHCSEIIITNEDPYDENPSQILSEIKSGITNHPAFIRLRRTTAGKQAPITNFYEILDRREAIRKALELARPGDTVVITGKGCEPWICEANGRKIPWDDRKVVREEFEKIIPTTIR